MNRNLLEPGTDLPEIILPCLGGERINLSKIEIFGNWKMLIFYRGIHCPMCIKYLKQLEKLQQAFVDNNVEILAVSSDPKEKSARMAEQYSFTFPLAFDLSVEQMFQLGLYVSNPASPQETDRPFNEPGMFILNADAKVHIIDISNAPFARPDIKTMKGALDYIRLPQDQRHDPYGAKYPIRGRHGY